MPHEFRLDKANSVTPVTEPATVSAPAADKPAAKTETPAVQPAAEHDKKPVEAKADTGAPPAPKGDDDDDFGPPDANRTWTYAAVKQEREKRRLAIEKHRKAEEELAYLRGQIEAMKRVPKEDVPAPEQPSDDDLDREYFSKPRQYTHQTVEKALETIREERYQERLESSEERAREKWQDYDETVSEFVQYLHTLPPQHAQQLYRTIRRQHRDPAAYVYQQVKLAREARKYGGSIDGYMKKVEADTRAKLEAEYKQKAAVVAAENLPKNMAGGAGPGLNTPPGQQGLSEWDKWKSHKKF